MESIHKHDQEDKEDCACSHDHKQDGHSHNHDEHDHGDSCCSSCAVAEDGHSHGGCGCGHDHSHGEPQSKALLWIGLALAIAAVLPLPLPPAADILGWIAATLLVGWGMFQAGLRGLVRLSLDELTLVTIAVAAAFVLGEFAEAFLVTFLFRLGELLEERAVSKSRREIEALTAIRPEYANLLAADGSITQVNPGSLPVGSRILIKTGERVPIDAEIVEGMAQLDTSALTGESALREAGTGDRLLSGSINVSGAPVCVTTSRFEDSAAMRIIQLVQEASASKGTTERFITSFARIYTPAVVVLAVLIAVIPPLLGLGEWAEFVSRALVFLVASCPCALVISVPLSFFAGIGACSKSGVLVKGSKYLERLAKLEAVVFDKTGTLTTGRPEVSAVHAREGTTPDEVLRLAAIAESYSDHPVARAVIRCYTGEIDTSAVADYSETAGMGITLTVGGDRLVCGSARGMAAQQIPVEGITPGDVYLARDGQVIGSIELFDHPREDAAATLALLRQQGIRKTVMLTGDNPAAAQRVADELDLDEVYAQLLPQQKTEHLKAIKEEGLVTAFVGDGINDAPVLATADVGFAMGLGTDAAMEAADVVLVTDRLSSIPDAVRLARRAMSVARFNIVFALGIKAVVLALGAMGYAQMWMAVFADVGVTVLTVLNSARMIAGAPRAPKKLN